MAEASTAAFAGSLDRIAVLPWHASALAQVAAAWTSKRFPHALLLTGAPGLGKGCFARRLAASLLCEARGTALEPCRACAGCRLVVAGSHPDLFELTPAEDKQAISVEQVREVCEKLGLTASRAGYRVAIVNPAHALTPSASNALLKTLEEPPGSSLLILVSSRPASLSATIRSRCQKIALKSPGIDATLVWLQAVTAGSAKRDLVEFVSGAPLRALEYFDGRFDRLDEQMRTGLDGLQLGRMDPLALAASWTDELLEDRLIWLDHWVSASLRRAIAGTDESVTLATGTAPLPRSREPLNITALYAVLDQIRDLRVILGRTALQRELALQNLLIVLVRALGVGS